MASGKWASSNRRSTLPINWPKLRNSILKRDGRQCQIRGPYCIDTATEVDHVGEAWDHRPEVLRSACSPCHGLRSAQQGAGASAQARRARVAARKREPERHPGICD